MVGFWLLGPIAGRKGVHLAGYRAVKLLLGAISSNLAGVVQPFWRAFSTPVPKRFSSRSPFAAGMAGADTATLAGPSRSNLTHRSQLDCSFLTPAHIHHSTTAKHFDVYRFKGIIGLCFNPSYFLFNILRQRCSIQSPSIPYHRSVPSRPTGCPSLDSLHVWPFHCRRPSFSLSSSWLGRSRPYTFKRPHHPKLRRGSRQERWLSRNRRSGSLGQPRGILERPQWIRRVQARWD